MLSPNTGQPMRLVAGAPATYTLRGQQFEVDGPAWECADTGERFVTDEQDHQMHERLHQAWRAHHGISPAALQQRREALGFSVSEAATLLGLSTGRYQAFEETHKLPSKANAVLLKLLLDPQALPTLVRAAGETLSAETRQKLPK